MASPSYTQVGQKIGGITTNTLHLYYDSMHYLIGEIRRL
jgi:hypothetical protein